MNPKALLLVLVLGVGTHAACAEKPNILVILADDMGYGDCSAYNPESKIVTPNIDRLAREGMLFTDAHSASATCTASRYGLLTGINPARRGVVNGITGLGPVLEDHEVTVAELLRDQGYTTRMVGKWHLGFEMKAAKPRPVYDFTKPLVGGPLDQGFDSFFGLRSAVSAAPYFFIRDRSAEAVPAETTKGNKAKDVDRRLTYGAGDIAPGFVPEEAPGRLCDEVVTLLREHAESTSGEAPNPLFLYYAMLQPHTPWLPEDRFGGKSGAGSYGDYLVQMDHEVGRVLDALKENGYDQNTLVIFSSDNGSLWPEADIEKWGHRANGPLAGGKALPEEGGHRLPFIVRWPGQVPAGATTDATINHTDFLATLAELFELDLEEVAPEAIVDSHSFLPVLKDPTTTHERPAMSVTAGSFRLDDWKLTFNRGSRAAGPDQREADNASLYHLAEDLGETQDLSESQPERKAQLFAAYRRYFASLKLKPLAEQVQAKKRQAKASASASKGERKKSGAGPVKAKPLPSGSISKEDYHGRRAELLKAQDELLTEEQKQSRELARKKAIEEGKKGVSLRNATDAGAHLNDSQKQQWDKLRKELGELTRHFLESGKP